MLNKSPDIAVMILFRPYSLTANPEKITHLNHKNNIDLPFYLSLTFSNPALSVTNRELI